MIPDKIQALFNFIDYLHNNRSLFLSHNSLIDELIELRKKQDALRPIDNYKKRIEENKLQDGIKQKWGQLQESLAKPFMDKILELKIYDWNDPTYLFNSTLSEIIDLKENFGENDIKVILEYKAKYLNFRTETDRTYFQDMFFADLDNVLKELFDFFKEDVNKDEFETFDNTVEAESLEDAIDLLRQGDKVVRMPFTSLLNIPANARELEQEKDGFEKFLSSFKDEVMNREDDIVSMKPDIFNKITEQRDKLERADFDEERKEIEEWAKKGMKRFKGSLSRWYTKYGKRELSTERGRKAVLEQSYRPVEVLAYFRCKELYQTATNSKHVNNAPPRKRKFTANEDALAYIFDLYACGKRVPKNPVEGGFAANEIKEIGGQILLDGHKRGWDTQGAFYKAVKHVLRYDLNSISDLKNISADWLNAVKTLSRDWPKTRQYLTEKNLIDTSINDSGE